MYGTLEKRLNEMGLSVIEASQLHRIGQLKLNFTTREWEEVWADMMGVKIEESNAPVKESNAPVKESNAPPTTCDGQRVK